MLAANQEIELSIEKPAAGGRMIARHDRQVVLVRGAIPGERIRGRIERVERQVAFASTIDIIDASPDRRESSVDLLCGGCSYAHVTYQRQLQLKAEVILDAFARLGRIPLTRDVIVAESPDRDYRMRARLHVRGGRIGFYREGTHEICDAAPTRQLSEDAVLCARRVVDSLEHSGCSVGTIEFAENIAADQRIAYLTPVAAVDPTDTALDAARRDGGLTGCSARTAAGVLRTSGLPVVSDPLSVLTCGQAQSGELARRAESFFQANRFLLPRLVGRVTESVRQDGAILDLYAGVGLFSVSLAAAGRGDITAVEGDRTSGSDLQRNAIQYAGAIRVRIDSVENHLRRRRGPSPSTVVVDPPRTGISRDAMQAVAGIGAERIVYVSCDPATMARDARRLLDGAYRLVALEAFDLFPNTPHVETLAVFER